MSELTTEQLVKIIVGIFVVVAVLVGIFFIFKDKIIDFFKSLPVGNESLTFWLRM
jgi:hypothetical protein